MIKAKIINKNKFELDDFEYKDLIKIISMAISSPKMNLLVLDDKKEKYFTLRTIEFFTYDDILHYTGIPTVRVTLYPVNIYDRYMPHLTGKKNIKYLKSVKDILEGKDFKLHQISLRVETRTVPDGDISFVYNTLKVISITKDVDKVIKCIEALECISNT